MILIGQVAHGNNLVKMLAGSGVKVEFIRGETDNDERQRALNRLASGETQILIGTNILDVGVDVPAVGLVILLGGGKAEISLRQRIGRGARRKKRGPNIFFVLDFTDVWNRHTADHARERQRIIRETPGFVENILPPGQDFDYSPFIKRAA
jgi:superfamily II DNA or RNA helicase